MSSSASSSFAPARRLGRSGPRRTVGLGVLTMALLLSACGSETELGGKVIKDGIGCTITESERVTDDIPKVEAGVEVSDTTTTTDLIKADKDACKADPEHFLTLDLVGATAADGKQFTSTYDTDRPLTVKLGQGKLLTGLETGLTDMPVGARRQIVIPAAEAYGAEGNEAQGIGADQDLVFIVDLLGVTDAPKYCVEAQPIPEGTREGKPTEVKMPVEAPTDEVTTTVITEGDGPEVPADTYLTVEYLGVACSTGEQFDSSWDADAPITIALGDAEPTAVAFNVIPGWGEGLVGQKQGSTVQIDIPYEDAYGAAGQGSIGPNEPLTFIVEIVEVSDTPPPDPNASTTVPTEGATTTTAPATTTTAAN